MTIIEFLDAYILYILGASLALYIVHSFIDSRRTRLDSSIIDSLNNIAQELDAGNSIESAIFTISKDKSNPSAHYFKKVIDETKKGHSFEESLHIAGKKTKSATFAYVCDIIYLAQSSKGNISESLKKLSQNLWEIDHLQTSVNSKAAGPITTLKFLGIIIIPLLYYMMASLLSSETIFIQITLPFQIYFFVLSVIMAFSDYLLFRDIKEGLYILPFALSYTTLAILSLGVYVAGFFTG